MCFSRVFRQTGFQQFHSNSTISNFNFFRHFNALFQFYLNIWQVCTYVSARHCLKSGTEQIIKKWYFVFLWKEVRITTLNVSAVIKWTSISDFNGVSRKLLHLNWKSEVEKTFRSFNCNDYKKKLIKPTCLQNS